MPICVLFSGQGSQSPGMGRELYENFPSFRRILECGSDLYGRDLYKLSTESDAETLSKTENAQPVVFAHSIGVYTVLKEELGLEARAIAGHSLGEYAALTAGGVLTLENAFTILLHRATAMAEAVRRSPGNMYAVIGLPADAVERVCEEVQGYVLPVNYNAPTQTVIAGETDAAADAAARFAQLSVRCQKLATEGAFHTGLMTPAAEMLHNAIADIPFCEVPSIPFYSNVTGERMESIPSLADYLARHMVSPVRFTDQLTAISMAGCGSFVEAGPGKVLSGLVKRTLKDMLIANVEDLKSLQRTKESFGL